MGDIESERVGARERESYRYNEIGCLYEGVTDRQRGKDKVRKTERKIQRKRKRVR